MRSGGCVCVLYLRCVNPLPFQILYEQVRAVGLYIVLTSYGAHAVREFIGKEMYVATSTSTLPSP